MRQCYIGRATDPALNHLTICLLGTATPAELIQDTRTSPFNISRRVEVKDFTPAESAPLAQGLGANGPALLARVLYWTGGHPYLTQRLCRAAQESGANTPSDVDKLCSDLFLTHKAAEADDNLAFVRNRLLKSEVDLAGLLDLYRRMRAGRSVPDDETNPLTGVLKLSGVARVDTGTLKVRNRIYAYVFDTAWVTTHMPDTELRRQREAYRAGVLRSAAIAACVVLMAALVAWALQNARSARSAAVESNHQKQVAKAETLNAQAQTQRANKNASEWAKAQQRAEQAAIVNADLARKRAAALTEATRQRKIAQTNAVKADTQARIATAKSLEAHQNAAVALTQKQRADSSAHNALAEKTAAERNLSAANRNLYAADMSQIQLAWDNNNVGQDIELLRETQHSPLRQYCGFEWGYWNRMCHLDLVTLKGHTADVFSAAFSPNGQRILTASQDTTAKVWDAQTGRELLTLKGQANVAFAYLFKASAAFSPDGKRIVTASADHTATVWLTDFNNYTGK